MTTTVSRGPHPGLVTHQLAQLHVKCEKNAFILLSSTVCCNDQIFIFEVFVSQ